MRIRPVVNLHTANRFTVIGQPLMIMSFSFAVILVVGIIANSVTSSASDLTDMYQGMRWNGAIFALLGPLGADPVFPARARARSDAARVRTRHRSGVSGARRHLHGRRDDRQSD